MRKFYFRSQLLFGVITQALLTQHGDAHSALHEVMDCLAEMIWRAQREQAAFDAVVYLNCLDDKLEK